MNWLADPLPDHPKIPKGGRPVKDKPKVLHGIYWMLDSGAKRKDLPRAFGARATVHRWFQRWTHDGLFEHAIRAAGRLVETHRGYLVYECFIDETFRRRAAPAAAASDGA